MKENLEINPIIHAAIAILFKVDAVESIELISDKMYRTEPCDECKAGCLGVDVWINDIKVFLHYGVCEDLITYSKGGFFAVEFVHEVLRDVN